MSLRDTSTRVLLAALIALLLFTVAFFIARGSSSQAALPAVTEQPAKDVGAVSHAPLRAIGAVPALPRAPKKKKNPTSPPPPVRGPVTPVAPPAPPPQPPPPACIGEVCR